MHLSFGELAALALAGAAGLYFLAAIRVRELALQAVGRASRSGDFQLLDQSVHLRRISLSRDKAGRWRVWRQYRFDYSYDGAERRQGSVVMLGRRLESIVISEPDITLH
ncbi:MAG: DUF3301 domain-containing protein [Pseudomonadota bacterium]